MSDKTKPDIKPMLPLLAIKGVDLIPLHQAHAVGANGKKAGKRPLESNWLQTKALTRATLETYVLEQHNIGVRLGRDVLVVDIDPRNFALEGETDKDGNKLSPQPHLALEKAFGFKLSDYPTVLTGSYLPKLDPSTGLHVYMRIPKGMVKDDEKLRKALAGYKGIDFKWFGGQVVAPGSVHPDTNRLYGWEDFEAPPIDEMGDAPGSLIKALVKPPSAVQVQDGFQAYTGEQLQNILDTLNVEDFRDQEKWLQFMMGCHAATQGEGMNEFVAWSTSDPMYTAHGSTIAYRWESLDANSKGGITHTGFRKIVDDNGGFVPADASEFAEVDEDEDEQFEAPNPSNPLRELNESWTFCREGGQVKVYCEEVDFSWGEDSGFNRRCVQRYPTRAFTEIYQNKLVMFQGKQEELGKSWLKWAGRNDCGSVQFLPEYGDERYPVLNGVRIYNLWRGFGVIPNPDGDCSMLYRLIDEALTNNLEEREYLLNWMAYAVQHPERAAEVACIFRGEKGTGKSTLGSYFASLFGDHGIQIASKDLLTGRFNLHLRDVILLFADEAFFAGDKDGESRLKGLITEARLLFEGKGTNAEIGRNCLHVMMATNSDWAAPATADGERRFAVFDVSNEWKQDKPFFAKLRNQMDNGGLGKLLHDMKTRDLGDWHPREDVPKSEALMDQMLQNLPPLEQFVFTMMYDENAELCDPIEDGWYDGTGGVLVLKEDFIAAYARFVKKAGGQRLFPRDLSPQVVGRQLRSMLTPSLVRNIKVPLKDDVRFKTGTRKYCWEFAVLDALRDRLDTRAGQPLPWPQESTEDLE